MELKFLGGLTIQQDGESLTELKSKKGQALVCYLALNRKPVTRPYLAALFWPDVPDTNAFSNLRKTLQRLKPLADYLLIERETVGINPDADVWLDVAEFEKGTAVATLSSANSPKDISRLQTAVALYQGDFLEGFMLPDTPIFEEWVLAQRARLREKALSALHYLVSHFREQGEFGTAIKYTRQRLALEPWHEETHRALMELLALSGQRSEALVQFETCRRVLADELDVEPAAATVQLYEQIKAEMFDEAPKQPEPKKETPTPENLPPHNLPSQPTPFIGRSEELEALDTLIADPAVRLVTILGPGGMGKTRLAISCAERLLSTGRFTNGVYFVALAPLSEVPHIVPAIAAALNVSLDGDGDPKSQLLKVLQSQKLLLVMDNFEHLLDGVELMAEIVQTAPGVKILATSRERLLLHGEQVYPIQGLMVPFEGKVSENIADYSAVQLFLQSARRVRPTFALGEKEHIHLTSICHLVAGMPLGIELAAAWVEFLSLAEIENEIQRNLDFLETEIRNVPERHRSMRAVFDGSWQRMSQEEQAIFIRLSVFRGGFTRDAAEAVAGATFRQLGRLVFKSLLQYDQKQKRYQLHELLRQYGAEKLAEDEVLETAVRSKHSDYFCAFLQQQEAALKSAGVLRALKEIGEEIDNVRKAWEWSATHLQVENLAKAATSLGWFYYWPARHQEGEAAVRFAAERLEVDIAGATQVTGQKLRLWSKLLAWQSRFANQLETYPEARAYCEKALDILGRPELSGEDIRRERAFVLEVIGFLQLRRRLPDIPPDVDFNADSLSLYQEIEDQWGTAFVLARLGEKAIYDGNYEAAERYNREAWELADRLGHPLQQVWPLINLGWAISLQERHEEGYRWVQKAVEISRANDYDPGLYVSQNHLGRIAIILGQFSRAHSLLTDSTTLAGRFDYRSIRWAYSLISQASLHLGNYEEAETITQKVIALYKELREVGSIAYGQYILARVKLAQGHHQEAHHLLRGCARTFRELDYKSDLSEVLATKIYIFNQPGSILQSDKNLHEALTLALEEGEQLSILYALSAAAYFFAQKGLGEQAVEYYALASSQPHVGNSRWFEDVVGRPIAEMTANLPPAVAAAAKERGRKRDLWQTAESLLTELAELGWDQETETQTESDKDSLPTKADGEQPRFIEEELVATGGFGEVYRGRDTSNGKVVIIKRLKSDLVAEQPDMMARFVQEGELLRQLNHPNIVQMIAYQEIDGQQCLIMEYVAGGTLRELMDKEAQLTLTQTLDIALELADALTRAHHLSVVHRDLKPGNVLLAEDGTPRLTDFGIARMVQREGTPLTQGRAMMGTMEYMSPEAFQGQELDGRTDIWSFGVLLFEMLAGERPFTGDQIAATIASILNNPPPDLLALRPDTPPALAQLIERMLVKDRGDRIGRMRQVAAELDQIRDTLLS